MRVFQAAIGFASLFSPATALGSAAQGLNSRRAWFAQALMFGRIFAKTFVLAVACLLAGNPARAGGEPSASGAPPAVTTKESAPMPESFIFRFRDDMPAAEVKKRAALLVQKHGGTLGYVYSETIKGFSATLTPQAAKELASDPDIVGYEPDQPVSIFSKNKSKAPPKQR
jgi:hypothetical protein